MVIDNMEVEKMFIEEGKNQMGLDEDPYEVTKPENILKVKEFQQFHCQELLLLPEAENNFQVWKSFTKNLKKRALMKFSVFLSMIHL